MTEDACGDSPDLQQGKVGGVMRHYGTYPLPIAQTKIVAGVSDIPSILIPRYTYIYIVVFIDVACRSWLYSGREN